MRKNFIWLFSVIMIGALCGGGLAQETTENIPRPEYPRPQFVRNSWINLNGDWTYTFDFGESGKQRGLAESTGFETKITVPFCPESPLSGVNYKDFIDAMWYQREIFIPADWTSEKILLHFGAVDYKTEVFVDGTSVGKHWGGTSSFEFDIAPYVKPGQTHSLVVYVIDDLRSGEQPSGKQCRDYNSRGVHYTRTTGIWQTVWMEPVTETGLKTCRIVPDLDQKSFYILPQFFSLTQGQKFRATVFDGEKKVDKLEITTGPNVIGQLKLKKPKTWSPENPFLYDFDSGGFWTRKGS